MKSRTLWIVLGLLAAIAAAAVAVLIINLDAYLDSQRPWLEETASGLLARDVSAKRVESKFWGGVGVRVEDLVIGDDPAHSKTPFLVAESLEVRIGLMEVLRGELDIRSATLIAPILRLHQSPRGWNVESLGESSDDASKPDASGDESGPIRIDLLSVERGTVHYTNSTEPPAYTLVAEQVEIEARDWQRGAPFELRAKAILTGTGKHDLDVHASVHPQEKKSTGIELELKGIALDSAKLAAFAPIARALPEELSASGPLHATLSLKGDADALDFDGTLDVEQVGLDSELMHKPAGDPMQVAFRGNSTAAVIDVSGFELTALGSKLVGKGSLRRSDPAFLEFSASSDEISLAALGLQAEPVDHERVDHERVEDEPDETEGDETEGDKEKSGEPVDLANTTTASPDETMKGLEASGRIALVEGPYPIGKLALRSTSGFVRSLAYRQLRVDADLREEGPFVAIRSPNGTIDRLAYEALHVDVNLEHEQWTVDDARAQVLGGQLRARGHTRANAENERQSHLQLRMDAISAKALETLLRPGDDGNVEGTLTLRVQLDASGSELERLRETLQGNVALTIEEGVLHNVKLSAGAIDALKSIPGIAALFNERAQEGAPALLPGSGSQFETIEIKAQIGEGVARTEKITIVAPSYKIIGQGSVTLLGVVDATGILTFNETFTRRLGGTGQLLSGLLNPSGLLAIPVKLVGTLPDIETEADPAYVARALRDGLIMGTVGGIVGGANKLLGRPVQEAAPKFELELGRAAASPPPASESESESSEAEPEPANP